MLRRQRWQKTDKIVIKQTLSSGGMGRWKYCSSSTVFPAVPVSMSLGDSEMYVKDRVDGGGLEDEHLEHAACLLTEPSLAVEIAPGEGHRPHVSVGIYKTD